MNAHHAVNTSINYRSSWKTFGAWCEEANRRSLPATPETLMDFILTGVNEGLR